MAESNHKSPSQYRSYLLRIWLEDDSSTSSWRIALIDPKTDDRRGFTNFEQLVDFLREDALDKPDSALKKVDKPSL